MPRRVLSFDVGLRNLAVAALEIDPEEGTATVHAWRVLPLLPPDARLRGASTQTLCDALFDHLDALMDDALEGWEEVHDVLIEQQMTARMKQVQSWLYAYFMMRRRLEGRVEAVSLVSPSLKLADDAPTAGRGYKANKTQSVAVADRYMDDGMRRVLARHRKKDDLCDALLQAVAWCRKVGKGVVARCRAADQLEGLDGAATATS